MQRSGFVMLDKEILNTEISGGALKLYCILEGYCYGNKTYCFPSEKTLAIKIGRSVRTVQRYLKTLIEIGLIKIKRRGSISNLYMLLKKYLSKNSSKDSFSKKENKKSEQTAKNIQDKCALYKGKSKSPKESVFNDFPQRQYDLSKLEEALLGHAQYDYEDLLK